MQYIRNMKFNIIPVFFNIGIDEHATVAEKLGRNGPQEKNNSDNFKILVEYVRKFKQKNFFNHISMKILFYINAYGPLFQDILQIMMKH